MSAGYCQSKCVLKRILAVVFLWQVCIHGEHLSVLVVESGDRVVFDQATLLGISSGKKAAETALSATADTAGIETASGKDPLDVGQPGRVVLDRLRPGLFRYPLGTRSNFWNPDYYTTLLDPERGDRLLPYPESGAFRFDRRLPGSDSYFDRYILDTEKMHSRFVRNNRERLEEPLDDLVRLATNPDSPMTVTFVCNMTTPGADYFYHIDRNDGGKTARDAPPRRVDSSTVTKDVYPLSPYDLSVEEPHLWWRHMKWRAFACLNLLKRAHRSGLPADRIRVELGNELYLERSQYVTEVFPPDMRFW
ncbi:MAG: hypothetical protein KDI30_00275, partial [Pseudomonadales bacterium]|nr:hypothetical protein [Pseudomonadales bacterium]